MASDTFYVKPGRCCDRCSRVLDGAYTFIYTNAECNEVKSIICDICSRVDRLDYYKKTGIITTQLMMEGSMFWFRFREKDGFRGIRPEIAEFSRQNAVPLTDVGQAVEKLGELTKKFEEKHWVPYLKKYWNTHNGFFKSVFDQYEVLMGGCAGRVLITINHGNEDVTMIFSDYEESDELRGGVQGINATKENAFKMLQAVIDQQKLKFVRHDNIRIA